MTGIVSISGFGLHPNNGRSSGRDTTRRAAHPLVIALGALAVLFVGLATGPSTVRAADAIADRAGLQGDAALTRFVAEFSREVDFEVFALSDPYRVVVELPDVKFRLPDNLGGQGQGLVSAFRYGLFAPGKARIVIDITQPVLIQSARLERLGEGEAVRFVLDLAPTDKATFLEAVIERRQRERAEARRLAELVAPKPVMVTPGMAARKAGKTVIVVDAGHGGIDTGAKSRRGTKEKDILLAVAKVLRKELQKRPNYSVVMTRETDVFVPLRRRVQIARENEANLFISLHADSLPRRYARKVRGATVYTLSSRGSDGLAREFAARENNSDVIAGVEIEEEQDVLAGILYDLARRESKMRSANFSDIVVSRLRGTTALNRNPQRSAAFRVLKSPEVPSVLIELGYISNARDEKELLSSSWRNKVSAQIANAVDDYFEQKVARFPF